MTKFEKGQEILTVSVRPCAILQDGRNIGQVTRNTDSFENIVAELTDRQTSLDAHTINHAMQIISDEVIRRLQAGRAVDLNGLGILRLVVKGAVSGSTPDTAIIPGFKVRFTPSEAMQEAVKTIKVDKVVFADPTPEIDKVIDLRTQNKEGALTEGTNVRVTGSRLKIAGTGSGIFFAKVNGTTMDTDESLWKAVDMDTVSCNTPKKLDFFLPLNVSPGESYCIVLRTKYSTGVKGERKQILQAVSLPISIV